MKGFKDNLARAPDGNDRSQAQNIMAGECDLALGNTYYVGLMMNNEEEPEQKDWANAIKVIFPTIDEDCGTHVNVSGMALAKNAPNRDEALELMRFLASDEAQEIYAAQVYEYPVKAGVEAERGRAVLRRAQRRHAAARPRSPRTAARPPKWSIASASTMARAS